MQKTEREKERGMMGRLARRGVNGGDANARLFVKPQSGYQGTRREPGTRRDKPAGALIGCRVGLNVMSMQNTVNEGEMTKIKRAKRAIVIKR